MGWKDAGSHKDTWNISRVTTVCKVPDWWLPLRLWPCLLTWNWFVLRGQSSFFEWLLNGDQLWKCFGFFFLAWFSLLLIFHSARVLQTPYNQILYLSVRSFLLQRQMSLPFSVNQGPSLLHTNNLFEAWGFTLSSLRLLQSVNYF